MSVQCKRAFIQESIDRAKQEQTISLPYLVRYPTVKSENTPVLIILHGYGANMQNLHEPIAPLVDPQFLVVSLQAPIELRPNSFAWYPISFNDKEIGIQSEEEEKAKIALTKNVDEVIQFFNADPDNVFLLGFSQGAILSTAVALSSPDKIKACILLSGQLPRLANDYTFNKNQISDLNLFISHGKQDHVISISKARELNDYLSSKGIKNLKYQEHEGAHNIDGNHIREAFRWIVEKI